MKYKQIIIKITFLIISIILMGLAQSILSYTHRIGMAPIDSLTQSCAFFFNVSYSIMNYITFSTLVLFAIIISKPKDRLKTSLSFITGYILAIFVQIFVNNLVLYFPGLTIDNQGNGDIENYWWGIFWFFFAYFLLVFSIGIWLNIEIGLRPYEALLIKQTERSQKKSYIYYRNIFDLSFLFFSLIIGSLSLLTNDGSTWIKRNSVGPGTIIFVFLTGYLSNSIKQSFGIFFNKINKI